MEDKTRFVSVLINTDNLEEEGKMRFASTLPYQIITRELTGNAFTAKLCAFKFSIEHIESEGRLGSYAFFYES